MRICDNEMCSLSECELPNGNNGSFVYVLVENEVIKVERYLYKHRDGISKLYLCDVCHAAANLIMGKQ